LSNPWPQDQSGIASVGWVPISDHAAVSRLEDASAFLGTNLKRCAISTMGL
jgi:hypothetical protein